ncbi:glycosyltransferase [Clostridioides difficile]|uniref:glycosyltransferase n=1 Tax=Clostridioides difficile TaxID=1496 RepID=UPI000B18136A|nr:glycosyltransferase [Clostridioides difficile]AXU48569.1 glycosyl transferase group 2 family protein [Clostridioides difficile]MCI4263084.1 glycosyltransferase [Clostridioides difficile]MCK1950635.1 glycosyltransferase [Clostridioides difficile]MCV2268145.1 glycosyltransferase [Clostridioides difficile]MDY6609274.1 glycosyltransferase [Clostridioides difficile]
MSNGTIKIDRNILKIIKKWKSTPTKKESKFTSIIILTYNQLEYTKICIESIRKFTNPDSYEIIIIDNNSTDGTINWLKTQEDVTVIYNNENLGFPKGCNQGIKIAKGDNILLLNNDTIVTPNWLSNMNKALWSSKEIGAVGTVSNYCSYNQEIHVNYNNIEEMLEFAYNFNKSNTSLWYYRNKLIGYCLMIKKEVLDKVGLLDEIFTPGNFEDDDISFRMLLSGYKLFLCKDTFIHHFGSISFKSSNNSYHELLKVNSNKFKDKWEFNALVNNTIQYNLISKIDRNENDEFTVLEIGCGLGATLVEIKNIYKNAKIYGIENNPAIRNIARNSFFVQELDVENDNLGYNENYFDYIILGDILSNILDPWALLEKLRKFIKIDGYILASIPNIMNVHTLRNLINGEFLYSNNGLQNMRQMRFFTLAEIQNLFNITNYNIFSILAVSDNLSKDDELFIDNLCEIADEDLRNQYKYKEYIVKAGYAVNNETYENENLVELGYRLIRIDNELDIENSLDYIFDMEKYYKDMFISHLLYLIKRDTINKVEVLNRIGVEAFNRNLYNLSVSIFTKALDFDRNNIDTIYNISYISSILGEYEVAINIIDNSSTNVKNNEDIVDLRNRLKINIG